MKRLLFNSIILLLLFLLPVRVIIAQTTANEDVDITGLWKGSLYNDTTKKTLPYEIAISDNNGKLTGYSYTLFDIDGKKEMGVKKIKLKRKDGQIIIEDVELISNNYSEPPPRKVKMQGMLNLVVLDTAMDMAGKWSTNQTREYRPLTGSMQLHRAIEYKALVLFKKLEELKLEQGLSFVQTENKRVADIALKEKATAESKRLADIAAKEKELAEKKRLAEIAAKEKELAENKRIADIAAKEKEIAEKKRLADIAAKEKELAENKRLADIAAKEKERAENKRLADIAAKEKELAETKRLADIAAKEKELAENKRIADIAAKEKEMAEKKRLADIAAKEKELAEKKRLADIAAKEKELAEKKRLADIAAKEKQLAENKRIADIAAKEKEMAEKKRLADIAAKEKAVVRIKPTSPEIAVKEPVKKEASPVENKQLPVVGKQPAVNMAASAFPDAAAKVSERKMSNEQSVFFESDSLMLTLYDNGDVDGDTVSVLMNGQLIFAKQGLSTRANSKTVYIDKLSDTISMVMYAENLGSIPPNTGLMIIMDGEKRYEVRFSADLKTNAAILLRRRPKEN